MASISAVSAYTNAQKTSTDIYKLYPTIATNTTNAASARVVLGTNYFFNTSGGNAYYVQLGDYQPEQEVSENHARVAALPAYRGGTILMNGARQNYKLFSSSANKKYIYTGSSEESDYGSFGPIICRYLRFIHMSGNVAYDYQRTYTSDSDIGPLISFDMRNTLTTSYDTRFYEEGFNQMHVGWLSSYVESTLDESIARHIVYNPAIVGHRFNTPREFHGPIRVEISKPAKSYIITLTHYMYLTDWLERRIGRFVFDFDIMI